MNLLKKRMRPARMFALPGVICALVVALLATGCSGGSKSVDPAQDRKAMMETAAKWYAAEDAQDLKSIKAAVYDPGNILGLATATPAPSSEPTTAFTWKWDGSNIVMTAPSQDMTITITNLAATPKNIDMYEMGGQGITLIMTKVDGAWKVDVAATQKAIDDAASKASGQESVSPAPGETP